MVFNLEDLDLIFKIHCVINSDINEHLPTLRRYAKECRIVTEMGVRRAVSTYAFLSARPKKLTSIDIVPPRELGVDMDGLENLARVNGIDFAFVQGDTTQIEIDETDLLFIDTLHVYEQLKNELELHASKVRKYLILHDTETFGKRGELSDRIGLQPAVDEFLFKHTEWAIKEKVIYNNGLTVLHRI